MATGELERLARRESLLAAVAAAAVSVAHVALAAARGALGAARNDDWTYYDIAFRLVSTGRFRLDGWTQALFAGQAVMAAPVIEIFGEKIAPLQCAVAVAGAVGLWACYVTVRRLLPARPAALCVACLALGPLYGVLSTSFMTDVPAFTLQMLTLLAGMQALRAAPGSLRWFTFAMTLGLLAFSVREYAVAAGLAVALTFIAQQRHADRRLCRQAVAVSALWVALLVALYWWRNTLDNSYTTQLELTARSFGGAARTAGRAAVTLGLLVAPAVVAISPARLARLAWRRSRAGSIVVVAGWLACAVFAHDLLGNYLLRTSAYSVTVPGVAPRILPAWLWVALHAAGLASLLLLGALAVVAFSGDSGAPSPVARARAQPPLALALVFTAAAGALPVAVNAVTDAPLFDRYLLPLVPFVAALALRLGRSCDLLMRPAIRVSGAALMAVAGVGIIVADAAATVDGAKWRIAQDVRSLGFAAGTIDGGYEWFGLHQHAIVHPTALQVEGSPLASSFGDDVTICVVVRHARAGDAAPAARPDPGTAWQAGDVVARLTARTALGVRYDLEAVATAAECVPSPP